MNRCKNQSFLHVLLINPLKVIVVVKNAVQGIFAAGPRGNMVKVHFGDVAVHLPQTEDRYPDNYLINC